MNIKYLINIFKKPIPHIFYIYGLFYDNILLRLIGKIWILESKLRGASIKQASFFGRPIFKLHPNSKVLIGNDVIMVSNNRRCNSGNIYGPCRLQTHSSSSVINISDEVGLNGTSIVCRSSEIHIGSKTMIAPNCIIMDSPFHRILPIENRHEYIGVDLDKKVVIGKNCWIGTNCIILAGSEIGENSVIAAGSIVNGIIPPNCLAIGRPAKPTKYFY